MSYIRDYLFGRKEQVMLIIGSEYVAKAEEIFSAHGGKEFLKSSTKHKFTEKGFKLDLDSDEPNRVTLCYLVDSIEAPKLIQEFYRYSITGINKHNPVYSRHYSIRTKLNSLFQKSR